MLIRHWTLQRLVVATAGLFALLLLLTACHLFGRPLVGPPVGPGKTADADGPGPALVSSRGTLLLVIHWPERDYLGFRAALIPTSTNAIALTVKTAEGSVLIDKVVQRQATQATVSVEVELDAASNLSVLLRAYREAEPDLANGTPIAQGTAAGVNVVPSKVTSLPIVLAPAFVPTITALSLGAGAVGDTLTLTGTNFGLVGQATPSVTFNGDGASVSATVTPIDVTKLQVVVPAGATVGRVVVTSDGVPSVSSATFWVAGALSISAPKAAWDSSAADKRIVLIDTTLQVTPSTTWVLTTGASDSLYGQAPYPAWDLADQAAGQISAAGLYTAAGTYKESRLAGKLGSIESNALILLAQDVTVTLSPATGSLGPAGAASIKFSAVNTFSDGSTNSLVTWSSSDTDKVVVTSTGTAVPGAKADETYGEVTITATPRSDTRRSAGAVATLTNVFVNTLVSGGFDVLAKFYWPSGVAVDSQGTIYVADTLNNRVRKITSTGRVLTLAGSGQEASVDGQGTQASFNRPSGVAVDPSGNVFVTDGSRVRRIAPDGTVSTLVSEGVAGASGLAVDSGGNLYVAVTAYHWISKISPDGQVSRLAGSGTGGFANGAGANAKFYSPRDVALDQEGNVYVADYENNRIRMISPDGIVSTLAGSGEGGYSDGPGQSAKIDHPHGVAVDSEGRVYVAGYGDSRIRVIQADGTTSTLAGSGQRAFADGVGSNASFAQPTDVFVDSSGNAYVADYFNNRIRKVAPDGTVSTLAGSGTAGFADGAAVSAQLTNPFGVAVDGSGNVFLTDLLNHRIRRIAPDGTISTAAGSGQQGSLDGTAAAAQFYSPYGVAVGGTGTLYVADRGNHRIRQILPGGTVSTLAGSGQPGYSNGAATSAEFNQPAGVAVDGAGNIIVGDLNNHLIRQIAPDGTVTTRAGARVAGFADGPGASAEFRFPHGVGVDTAGTVYVADYANNRIRKVAPDGTVSTLAGSGTAGFADGAGATAQFNGPSGVAVTLDGIVYVADAGNKRVRRVAPDGTVSTLAGSGTPGFSDGASSIALFSTPYGVAAGEAGTVYVADYGNNAIRKLTIVP